METSGIPLEIQSSQSKEINRRQQQEFPPAICPLTNPYVRRDWADGNINR